jgi:hypothetical protein
LLKRGFALQAQRYKKTITQEKIPQKRRAVFFDGFNNLNPFILLFMLVVGRINLLLVISCRKSFVKRFKVLIFATAKLLDKSSNNSLDFKLLNW